MNYKRLIPILLIKEGLLVRSQLYRYHQAIGDPIPTIKRMSDWLADEIVLLNISKSNILDSRRSDKWHNLGKGLFSDLVRQTSSHCFCPLSVGGGIRSIEDFESLFAAGADKCIVNTLLYDQPQTVSKAIEQYGSQAIVASLDVRKNSKTNSLETYTDHGAVCSGKTLHEAISFALELGVGELLISSIDNDGAGEGYSQEVLEALDINIDVPVVVNSGARSADHFSDGLKSQNISGVAASNVFYFTELSYPLLKDRLIEKGYPIRPYNLKTSLLQREPIYDTDVRESLFKKQSPSAVVDITRYQTEQAPEVQFCKRCFYPSFSATPMQFGDDGICMGCKVSDAKLSQPAERYDVLKEKLKSIIASTRSKSGYDCIVSVSGGKDSYYQTHYVTKELGLKALLVTYNGNNYSDVGWRNLWRMREVFDCDHIVVSPSVRVLKKLNRLAFIAMGDMNWHAHVGIFTTAPRIAVQQGIPLIFWGEHGYADLCGQFSMNDFPEMNYRERTEHAARGFDWPFFVDIEGITSKEMEPWKYPSDASIKELDLKQIHLGHYIPWEANDHLQMMVSDYDFEVSDVPFERTYRTGSNLDDIHENGIHDYLKYIKFGYGRCTDHASKDARANKLTREEGISRIGQMDHIKSRDLQRWLEYVDMNEDTFDRIADHFRDPRVWAWNKQQGWFRKTLLE